jgi:hypothetical protein
MHALRAFFLRHRALALAVVALALAMKALVPTGYMVGGDAHRMTVRICDGVAGHDDAQVITLPGHKDDAAKIAHDHQVCPYSALAHAGLGGADPFLLAIALAFILLLGFAPVRAPDLRAWARALPPTRGPPVRA